MTAFSFPHSASNHCPHDRLVHAPRLSMLAELKHPGDRRSANLAAASETREVSFLFAGDHGANRAQARSVPCSLSLRTQLPRFLDDFEHLLDDLRMQIRHAVKRNSDTQVSSAVNSVTSFRTEEIETGLKQSSLRIGRDPPRQFRHSLLRRWSGFRGSGWHHAHRKAMSRGTVRLPL